MDFGQLIFMAVIIALYTGQNFFCKQFSLNYKGEATNATPVLTVFGGIIVSIVSFFFSGMKFDAGIITVLLGALNALALYGYNYFLLKASLSGPYSVLIVFTILGGIAMPSLAKWIAFGEIMSGPAICFLLLIVLSVYLMSIKPHNESSDNKNGVSFKFILYSVCLAICNGVYGTILPFQQEFAGESEKEELIIITFLFGAILSLVSMLIKRTDLVKAFSVSKKGLRDVLFYAFCAAFAVNSLIIILLLDIDTGVIYTVQNAGVMLLSVALSMIFFKEKLTKTNALGCILMSASLVGIVTFAKTSFAELWNTISDII